MQEGTRANEYNFQWVAMVWDTRSRLSTGCPKPPPDGMVWLPFPAIQPQSPRPDALFRIGAMEETYTIMFHGKRPFPELLPFSVLATLQFHAACSFAPARGFARSVSARPTNDVPSRTQYLVSESLHGNLGRPGAF